jgi:hypothetical protein
MLTNRDHRGPNHVKLAVLKAANMGIKVTHAEHLTVGTVEGEDVSP